MSAETDLLQPEPLLETDQDFEMPTFEHGMICTKVSRHLGNFAEDKNLGQVVDSSAEYRFVVAKLKRPGRYPDVSFVRQERLPKNVRSHPAIAPDLAVEVASPTDKSYDIEARVKLYQKAGVKLVWIIYPFSRTINVYRAENGLVPQVVSESGTLDGEDVLPGFNLAVSKIFNYPPPPDEFDEEPDETLQP